MLVFAFIGLRATGLNPYLSRVAGPPVAKFGKGWEKIELEVSSFRVQNEDAQNATTASGNSAAVLRKPPPPPPIYRSREARDSIMANWLFFTRLHCAVYRGTGGLIGGNLIGIQVLLLTTKGRKTGKERTLPLAYVEDDGDYIVVASNGGASRPPAWWFNLREQPTAHVQVRGERFEVSWDLAPPERRTEYWRKLQAAVPAYRMYRHQTDREIPIVRLKRQVRIPTRPEANASWRTQELSPVSAPSGSTATARTQADPVNASIGS